MPSEFEYCNIAPLGPKKARSLWSILAPIIFGLGISVTLVAPTRSWATTDITDKGPNGLPIIFWRIEQDDRPAVKALLAAGVDIEIKGFQQQTPVLWAASANAWITTLMLIELGADLRASDRMGFTLPWLAQKARMVEKSPEGRALAEVTAHLAAQGLMQRIYTPDEVKALTSRNAWPPAGW